MEFCISQDEERFSGINYETKELAIAEGRASYPGERFYVGEVKPYQPWQQNFVDMLAQQEADAAYEEVGDIAEGWPPELRHEQETLLAYQAANSKIEAILSELYGDCGFFIVKNIETIEPEDAMCASCSNLKDCPSGVCESHPIDAAEAALDHNKEAQLGK